MRQNEVMLSGTLKPDGALDLDQKPELPVGRVQVVLRSLASEPPTETWWECLQRARSELQQSGRPLMNDDEVRAYVEDLRSEKS